MSTELHKCPKCSRTFESKRGLGIHKTTGHSKEYQDRKELARLYYDEGLDCFDIADKFNTASATISEWLEKYGLSPSQKFLNKEQQKAHLDKPIPYYFDSSPYPYWAGRCNGEREFLRVHRLLAISEGANPHEVFSSGSQRHVHHKNGVKWDNRADNIEFLTAHEHHREHSENDELKPLSKENHEIECACGCGETLMKYDDEGRARKYIHLHHANDR